MLTNKNPYGYLGDEYEYFKKMRSSASSNIAIGSLMVIVGAGLFVIGVVIVDNKLDNYSNNFNGQGLLLILVGAGGVGAGIPLIAVNAN